MKGKKTGGRRKGSVNKTTATLKDMILKALSAAGGVRYLEDQAIDNPGPFLTLVGKVLPMQVGGVDGQPLPPAYVFHVHQLPDSDNKT